MDVSNLVHEFVVLQRRVGAADFTPAEKSRWEILRLALRLAEIRVQSPAGPVEEGGVRLRLCDIDTVREIRIDEVTQAVIEVELHGTVKTGDMPVVVIEPALGSPAIATRAVILGPSQKGPKVYRLDLGSDTVKECAANGDRVAGKSSPGRVSSCQSSKEASRENIGQ